MRIVCALVGGSIGIAPVGRRGKRGDMGLVGAESPLEDREGAVGEGAWVEGDLVGEERPGWSEGPAGEGAVGVLGGVVGDRGLGCVARLDGGCGRGGNRRGRWWRWRR